MERQPAVHMAEDVLVEHANCVLSIDFLAARSHIPFDELDGAGGAFRVAERGDADAN
jgi:hypothetical protein